MPSEPAPPAEVPVLVTIEPGRATAAELLGAVDAALRSDVPGLRVRVPLAESDPRQATLAALCGADPRVALATAEERADVAIAMPASARPEPRTLAAVVGLVRDERLAAVEVPVPGRVAALARLAPRSRRLRASAAGSGRRRLAPGPLGLRSTRSRGPAPPPPRGTLEQERAEHLRHRARSATMRARMDRNAQRLYRERLQSRHDRSRRRLAEQRLAQTSAGEWVRWRARGIGRQVAALPGAAASGLGAARGFARRARRHAAERLRARRAGADTG